MKLKIIKSLLIPTLGITLSTTAISSLTSCTNNNEIKNYYLTGGSTQLSGIEGKAGSDDKQWQLSLNGNEITNNIDWAIEDNNGNQINGVFVNGRIVSWSANIAAGEYDFYVIATYDKIETKSPLIKLTISKYILNGGSTELSGTQGKAGSDDKPWQLSLNGQIITDNVNWTIEDNNGKWIYGMFVNGGIVSWVENMNAGEYDLYVIATYDEIEIKSPLIKLTISQYILDDGSVELNGAYGKAGSDTKSWQLLFDGKVITDNIDWTIEDNIGYEIDGISINGGIVSWSDNIAAGEYDFYVIATYDGLKVKSPQIKLTISQYILNGGSTELSGTVGQAGSDTKSWQLSLNGNEITNNIDWTIKDFLEDKPIDGISINKGIVSWSDNIAADKYHFYVIATHDGLTTKSSLINLVIS